MAIDDKWSTEKQQREIALNIRRLMLANVQGAFKTFDTSLISKYLVISKINFHEIKKGQNQL